MHGGAGAVIDDEGNDDEPKKRTRTPGAQLRLLMPDPSTPPFDRSQCPKERPCTRFGCWHHNWRIDERAGKPVNGMPAPPKLLPEHVRKNLPSCSLDVADDKTERDDDDELPTSRVAEHCNETPRRSLQVVARAQQKARIVRMLDDILDEHVRSKLPDGTLTTIYPENRTDPHHIYVTLAFRVPQPKIPKGAIAESGAMPADVSIVTIRRKK
jgi:hypothetical protein